MTRSRSVTRVVFGLAALVAVTLPFVSGLGARPVARRSGDAVDARDLQKLLTEEVRANHLPAAVIGVVDGAGKTAFATSGTQDGRPVSPDSAFLLGSVSKSVTAVAVMQLVEAGAVRLDDPVKRYLPAFDLADHRVAARITVRELLNHTSGLPPTACETESADLDGFVSAIGGERPDRPPGSRYEYCSGNYNLLGAVVEHVTGHPFGSYVRDRVFLPLGMTASAASESETKRAPLVPGHTWMFGVAVPLSYYNPSGVPAGYISSTARDMTRFLSFELGVSAQPVLSGKGLAATQRGSVQAGSGASYAMGWLVGPVAGVPCVYHYGTTFTYEAFAVLVPGQRRAAVVMVNAQGLLGVDAVRHLEHGVVRVLAGQAPPHPGVLTVPRIYAIANLVMLSLLAAVVRAAHKALRGDRARWSRARAAGEIVAGLGAVIVLHAFFRGIGARNWVEILRLLPDLAAWLLTLSAVVVVTGVARLARAIARTRNPEPSR